MYEVKICEAASLLNMDYELIEYITKADKYMSDQEITEKVNDIFTKYKKYLKEYRDSVASDLDELFIKLVVLFPDMKLLDDEIVACNHGLTLSIKFDEELVLNIHYYGISRYIRILKYDDKCYEIMRKDNNCALNQKLKDIYQILGINIHDLDFKEVNNYQDNYLVNFSVYKYETDQGIIVNDYQCEGHFAGSDNISTYYICDFEPTVIKDRKELSRPKYTLVQELMPEDIFREIVDLDYIEISKEEYQNMITFSEVKADSGIYDDNSLVNAVLLERKLPNYSVPPIV